MSSSRSPTPLESLARLRTMRALLTGEDRVRFERFVAEIEQAVWDMESVNLDLARLVATGVTAPPVSEPAPIDMIDVVAAALRNIDAVLATRGVLVDVVAPPSVVVVAEQERLEQLISMALVVAVSTVTPGSHVSIRYGPRDGRTVDVSLMPYSTHDPRATIVDALAQSQQIRSTATDELLTLALHAAVDAAPAQSA